MTTATLPARFVPPRRFSNAAEWLRSLGDVRIERIVFDPWPGTATEADVLYFDNHQDRLCELVYGTLVAKTGGLYESHIAGLLIMYLNQFILPRGLGVVTREGGMMRMSDGCIRIPDVAFVSIRRLSGRWEPVPALGPDLAVEVLSEGNTPAEIKLKLRSYFQSGTRLAWVIDPPTRTVAVYHSSGDPTVVLNESQILDGEPVLPGFTLLISDLFRNNPEAAWDPS